MASIWRKNLKFQIHLGVNKNLHPQKVFQIFCAKIDGLLIFCEIKMFTLPEENQNQYPREEN